MQHAQKKWNPMAVGKGVGEEVGYSSPGVSHREGVLATKFHDAKLSL